VKSRGGEKAKGGGRRRQGESREWKRASRKRRESSSEHENDDDCKVVEGQQEEWRRNRDEREKTVGRYEGEEEKEKRRECGGLRRVHHSCLPYSLLSQGNDKSGVREAGLRMTPAEVKEKMKVKLLCSSVSSVRVELFDAVEARRFEVGAGRTCASLLSRRRRWRREARGEKTKKVDVEGGVDANPPPRKRDLEGEGKRVGDEGDGKEEIVETTVRRRT
jgi:hypothetical protein